MTSELSFGSISVKSFTIFNSQNKLSHPTLETNHSFRLFWFKISVKENKDKPQLLPNLPKFIHFPSTPTRRKHAEPDSGCPAMCVGAGYLALVEVAVIEPTRSRQRTLALLEHRNHQYLHLRRRSRSRVQRRRGQREGEKETRGEEIAPLTVALAASYVHAHPHGEAASAVRGDCGKRRRRLGECVIEGVSERASEGVSGWVGGWGSV